MDNLDLTAEQSAQELAELIEVGEAKDNAKKEPKIEKQFVTLTKQEIDKLSKREQFEYKIELSKLKTEQLKSEYKSYKSKQTETRRSLDTKRLIIMGRFLESQFKREDRKVQYIVVADHLDRYLTKDSDRQLLGFPPLAKSDGAN